MIIKKMAMAAMMLLPSSAYSQIHKINERVYYVDEIVGYYVADESNLLNIVFDQDVEKPIRGKTYQQIQTLLKYGYIRVGECLDCEGNKTYKLYYTVRGLGGGPLSGAIGYWGTKILGYGGLAAAGGTAIAAGGGAIAGAVGVAAGNTAVAGAGAAATGAGLAGGAIIGAGGAEAAGGVMIVAEAAGGAVAAVETSAAAVGGVLAACPFLP